MAVTLTTVDLNFLLTQIEMAENGQPPINPLLSFGLRTVDGTGNNLVPGQETFGSADQPFPTITDPLFQNDYSAKNGLISDPGPRLVSNLISDQTSGNPAAMAAQAEARAQLGDGYLNTTTAGADGLFGTADDVLGGNLATSADAGNSSGTNPQLSNLPGDQSRFISNITPDAGLSAPSNSFFTYFGQFFDHGLDYINKDAQSGMIFMPLTPEDPLFVAGSPNNFMILTRAANMPGPDGVLGTEDDIHQNTNSVAPLIEQSQTYASSPSHQAFLRDYMIGSDGVLHSTGKLLSRAKSDGSDGMATWADLKANAAQFLGILIVDLDVSLVPLMATDPYGNLILGANGLAQMVVDFADGTQGLIEGDNTKDALGKFTNLTATHGTHNGVAYTAAVLNASESQPLPQRGFLA